MASWRYIILSLMYIGGYYFTEEHNKTGEITGLTHTHLFIIASITFLFFFITKYLENRNYKQNKLPEKYILSQSIFYTLIAVICDTYIFNIFLDNNCNETVTNLFNSISKFTFIPKGLFIAGFVLLLNRLSYLIYPKCE